MMQALLVKLNFKQQTPVVALQAPEGFAAGLAAALPGVQVITSLPDLGKNTFSLVFVTRQEQIDTLAPPLADALEGDGQLWFAYPKGTSKRYACDFNRDTGWELLGKLGFEPVRMVAVDEDWSALRFRRVSFIKKLTRSFAMTEEGKERAKKK